MLESLKAQVAALIAQAEAGIQVEVSHLRNLAAKVEEEAASLMGLAGISHTEATVTTTVDAINTGVEGATTDSTAAGATVEAVTVAEPAEATAQDPAAVTATADPGPPPTLTITRDQLAQAFARWEEENGNKDTSAAVGNQNADYMWAALQALTGSQ